MPDLEAGCHHPFGDNAARLHALGLVVVPCGKDDGKRPLVEGWQRPKSAKWIAAWAQRFADANIGVVCGASGIVVVDVDEPELVEEMLQRFGDTPLITRTPSGGVHLWYRKVGAVKSGTLRPNLEVDIKADRGQVIVPPSFNRQSGVPYELEPGSTWDDLARLPLFRQEALPPKARSKSSPASAAEVKAGPIGKGARNRALFLYLIGLAPNVDSYDQLLAAACTFSNEALSLPLDAAEMEKTARSAWRYKSEGRIWRGSRGFVVWSVEQVQTCAPHKHGGDAIILTTLLRAKHARRDGPIVVAPRPMAKHQVIPGWSEHRTRQALRAALKLGLVKPVYKGGHGLRDPSLYELPS